MFKLYNFILLLLIIYSCSPINKQHGYLLDDFLVSSEKISKFELNNTTKNDVFDAMGSPSIEIQNVENVWIYLLSLKEKKVFDEDFTFYDKNNNLKRINICKLDDYKNLNDYALITGKKLHSFEKDPNTSISVLIEENPKLTHNIAEIIAQLGLGFYLKNYSFKNIF